MPERMCVICRNRFEKSELCRLLRSCDTIELDKTGKAGGRGSYVCRSCMPVLLKKRGLDRAFRTRIPDSVYKKILAEAGIDGA